MFICSSKFIPKKRSIEQKEKIHKFGINFYNEIISNITFHHEKLDKEKFNLTIKDAKDISCALDAYIKIRKIEQMNFTINTSKDNNTLKGECQ